MLILIMCINEMTPVTYTKLHDTMVSLEGGLYYLGSVY